MTAVLKRIAAGHRMPSAAADGQDHEAVERGSKGWLAWLIVATLTALVTALTTYQSLSRYEEFRSGWSWDLAYYNQWFWALTHGLAEVTVTPLARYAREGPSIWKMNYLAPIRLPLAPVYWLYPDPRTLLVIQNVMFWWVVPAAYVLVRGESRSEAVAVSAALLVPLTPLFWPMVWNDFRELQLAAPFVLWAVHGIRGRSVGLAALGIAGMLLCRQEYAVMVATFAFLPARAPEDLSTTLRWRQVTLLVGLVWVLFGFFGYLKLMVGPGAPDRFLRQFADPKAALRVTLGTAFRTLLLGVGAWAILACLAPRIAILAVPWIWDICGGRWDMWMLETDRWSLVRYLMPVVSVVLAAGLVGYARVATWLLRRGPGGRARLAMVWLCAVVVCGVGLRDVTGRLARVPVLIDRSEAEQIWAAIRQIDSDEAVLADYLVSAPLSSRRWLYSQVLFPNRPVGYPELDSRFRWLFLPNRYRPLKILLDQGFEVVYRGRYLTIAHRTGEAPP
jgi:hypothetical protein